MDNKLDSSAEAMNKVGDLFLSFKDSRYDHKLGAQPWGKKIVDLIWYNSSKFQRYGVLGTPVCHPDQRPQFVNTISEMILVAQQVIQE